MENFKSIVKKMFLITFLLPLIAGFLGGLMAFYFVPVLNSVITKYVFVPKAEQKNQLTDNIENKVLSEDSLDKNIGHNINEELSITEVVDKVSPSVVSVIVSKQISSTNNNPLFNDFFPFGLPFNIEQPDSQPSDEKQQVGGGTGFIISSDGLIVTNKHVVSDSAATYSIVTSNGKTYDATVLDRDPLNDLAILKIQATGLPAVRLGDSSDIKVGQSVVAIGYALGEYSNSVTKGIVSGLGRDVVAGDGAGSSENLQDVIQTDAAINPGNSGGPLINLYGEVIGINTAVSRSGQLVGFSIPINVAKPVIASVIKNGKIVRPYLGVRYLMLNESIAKKNNLKNTEGALIIGGQTLGELAILANSPASKAGLKEGDIILSINDIQVNKNKSLANIIANYQPGQTIVLKIVRDDKELNVKVTLEEMKVQN